MKFNFFNLKNIKIFSTLCFLISAIILAPLSSTIKIQIIEAAPIDTVNVAGGPGSAADISAATDAAKTTLQTTLSAGFDSLVAELTDGLSVKEYVLDGIAWQLVNVALSEMIQSTTRWVNSGFNGSPAFVTDLNGFLLDIGDRVAGDFIWGTKLDFLCSPFKLNIQLALEIQYNASQHFETQCRLSQIVDNMDAFFDGDFLAGGWDGWYQMALVPGNNPYGAMLDAQAGLTAGIVNARGQEIKLLEFGRGFMSKKTCDDPVFGPQTCTINTPGSVIEEQLNNVLSIPAGRLTVADEINELVGALLSQLVNETLSGAGGLLGLTDSKYGKGNYFDRVDTENARIGGVASENTLSSFNDVITTEAEYRTQTRALLNRLNNARSYKNTTYGTSTKCASGALTDRLENDRLTAQERLDASNKAIADVQDLRNDLRTLQNENTAQATLRTLWTKYKATNTTQAQTKILAAFSSLRSGGILHSPSETTRIELEVIPDTKDRIKDFTDGIDASCKGISSKTILIDTTSGSGT